MKKTTVKRRINKKKARHELYMVLTFLFGLVILILNLKKLVPISDVPLLAYWADIVAYCGITLGPIFMITSVLGFLEIRNTKYPSNYPRKKAR